MIFLTQLSPLCERQLVRKVFCALHVMIVIAFSRTISEGREPLDKLFRRREKSLVAGYSLILPKQVLDWSTRCLRR